ncbi:unnamed protein product [Rotaria sordida]|uniref:Helicase C-terminal domain-containing protein n=2 Tax=Rotaria sordida TaxID=392033 RepID=A0A815A3Z9_9BILA|nr:unnamed protein product [Rotaria sordida]CAF1070967.1 unnamed protein product [Rotaria sordida]CAF1254058.1 unnamed protein product [Rotaria sordida]CAF4131390.1 unnamed protein product [Rotaria sordida]
MFPNQTEDYVHRIGRTGRNKEILGTSYTFFTSENAKQAPSLVRVLQEAGQNVNQDLMEIAEEQYSTTSSKYGSKNQTYNNQQQSINNFHSYPLHQSVEYIPSITQPMNYIPSLIYNQF